MFISFPSAVVALSLLSPLVSAGHMDKNRLPVHHNMFGRGLSANETESHVGLARRDYSGHSTWYKVGLGACGEHNVPSDFIVALNSAQYGGGYPGPNCFKTITIHAKGKTAQATIMDECPTCPYGCLDFSEGLFRYFADLGEGMFDITWSFGGGGGSSNSGSNNNDDNDDEERARKERQSRSSVSEKSTASVESVSRESRAELSSRSAASVRSEESEASRASVSSVSAFSVTSVAAIPTSTSAEFTSSSVADADLPAETHSTSASSTSESTFKAATISGNNLGLSLYLLKQFGNTAVVGAS